MKSHSSEQHMMDIMFPMALLVVFLLSAMLVLLLASDLYGRITMQSAKTNNARIAVSYLTEKVHQNDASGTVRIDRLADTEALVLEHRENGADYCTYIYFYDNALRELMIKKNFEPDLDRGRKILSLKDFQAEQVSDSLIHFSCADEKENSTSVYVAVQAVEE